jgi:glyoxylase-like metal-dependent hydrolase (beta-lactamase superfamily II)
MALGDLVAVDDRTLVVIGQPLDGAAGQPDVANAVVHRSGSTLVLIDTGATGVFRGAIEEAAHRLAPWSKVLLLTTHGHIDHVGNNDLADTIAAAAGVADVAHFVSAHDAGQLVAPLEYWRANLSPLVGVLAGYEDVDAIAELVLGIFGPIHPLGATTRTYESLPLEHLVIGPTHLTGWSFCDGGVQVVRTQGHCAGQVVVWLAPNRLLHLSDEANGPCAVMHDSDQVKMLGAVGSALTLAESGGVAHVTEGHREEVLDGAGAVTRLGELLDAAAAMDACVQGAVARPSSSRDVAAEYAAAFTELGIAGTNPTPMFLALAALAKLRDLGMVRRGDGDAARWVRPDLG